MDSPRSYTVQPLHHQVRRLVLWHLDLRNSHLRQISLPRHEQPTGPGRSPHWLPHALPSQLSWEAVLSCPRMLEGWPWLEAHVWNSPVDSGGVLLWRNKWYRLSRPGRHASSLVTYGTLAGDSNYRQQWLWWSNLHGLRMYYHQFYDFMAFNSIIIRVWSLLFSSCTYTRCTLHANQAQHYSIIYSL